MTKTNEQPTDAKHEALDPRDNLASDLETLKTSFAQLRDDLSRLLDNTLDTGKNGAGRLKARAAAGVVDIEDRLADLKDRGGESLDKFGRKIGERPLLSAAIALGIGFVLARLFSPRR